MTFSEIFNIIFVENQNLILTGFKNTLLIAFFGFLMGIALGIVVAFIKILPRNNVVTKLLNAVASLYTSFFRGTPIIAQLLLFYYGLLIYTGIDPVVVCIIIFGLNSGAYMSEIMRAGIQSIDKGQMEAGRSLGLNGMSTMFRIVLPQAIKNMIPTMTNEFIALVKETSVIGYISVLDITRVIQQISAKTYDLFLTYLILALIYYIIVLILSTLLKLIERRLRKGESR